jgi:hypothetical protein
MLGDQAKKVLHETISRDRFLGYMTADIKVTTRSRELYRYFSKILFLICLAARFSRVLPCRS